MAIEKYLTVSCPKCQAKPGEPCKIGECIKGAPGTWFSVTAKTCHDERVALSKEEAEKV